MAPVRLVDTPGWFVLNADDLNNALPDQYRNLRLRGYDFVLNSPAGTQPDAIKLTTEQTIGGASEYRPLTYSELDSNFKEVYPVGSIYMNADDSRNPKVIIGFGVWERVQSGKALYGVDKATTASTDRRNKILKASKAGSIVTLILREKPTESEEAGNILQPNAPQSQYKNKRRFNYYPGQKINVQGLKRGGTGIVPSGIFTILSVDSSKVDLKNNFAPSGTSEFDAGTVDQDTIKFIYTDDPNFEGNYTVSGNSTQTATDNAYVTYGDLSILKDDTTLGRVGIGITGGTKSADVSLREYPPHAHAYTGIKMSDVHRAATGYMKVDGANLTRWDRNHTWTIEDGADVPTAISQASISGTVNHSYHSGPYKADVTASGSGTSSSHDNRQPFQAVHMWKRVQ